MSNYYIRNGELYHWGVKGQKWGVRRYQNPDGSLTPEGRARYNKMSDDELQRTLHKQIREARTQQSDWSNQWNTGATIGKYSKAAQDRYNKARSEHRNSDLVKRVEKELMNLDNKRLQNKIDPDTYSKEWERIRKAAYRPDLDTSVTYTNSGKKYVKAYLDSFGRDINVGYLRDLGYNESVAKELADRVRKSQTKMLY